jgi:hypothetical protein
VCPSHAGVTSPKCLPAEVVEALGVEDRNTDLTAAKGQIADALAKQKGAEARIAEAEAQAAKAQLELAKLKQPTTLSPVAQDRIIAKMEAFSGQNFSSSVYPDPEPIALLRIFDSILRSASWNRVDAQIGAASG